MISTIIAAAGLGLRMYSETSELPKPLLHYKTKPIIAHLIDLYRKLSDDIIVVRSACCKGKLLEAWLKDYYDDPNWLTIIEQPKPSGTNDAVSRALPSARYQNLLISWSDFILNEDNLLSTFNAEEETFFVSNIDCRFSYWNGRISQFRSNPGFLGIYYLRDKPKLNQECDDFIENYLNRPVNVKRLEAVNLGTVSDLVTNRSFDRKSSRFFNHITMENGKVHKHAITDHAKSLQNKEAAWYISASEELRKYLPAFSYSADDHVLSLDKIDGKPLSKCQLDQAFWQTKLPYMLNALHIPTDAPVNQQACFDEYIDKPVKRWAKVWRTINAWFGGNVIINGEDYNDWKFPQSPPDLMPQSFCFIHGDLQFSNTMMDKNGDLKMIDPRAYMGSSLLFGDPAYDIAKLLYAVDAYHKINEGDFGLYKTADGNTILIHKPLYNVDGAVREFFELQCKKHGISNEKLNFLLFGIWMSLTSYIINDPLAIIASYCQALIRNRHPLL